MIESLQSYLISQKLKESLLWSTICERVSFSHCNTGLRSIQSSLKSCTVSITRRAVNQKATQTRRDDWEGGTQPELELVLQFSTPRTRYLTCYYNTPANDYLLVKEHLRCNQDPLSSLTLSLSPFVCLYPASHPVAGRSPMSHDVLSGWQKGVANLRCAKKAEQAPSIHLCHTFPLRTVSR